MNKFISLAFILFSISSFSAETQFQKIYRKIIDQKCVGCHDQHGFNGVDLSSYEAIMKNPKDLVVPREPELSQFYTIVKAGEMPLGYTLEKEELQLIYSWIKRGAKP